MSHDFTVVCRRMLPTLDDGWDDEGWKTPKTHAAVSISRFPADSWHDQMTELADDGDLSPEIAELLNEVFVDVIELNCHSSQFVFAEGYLAAIARAGEGVIIAESDEIIDDYAKAGEPMTAAQIEKAWKQVDTRVLAVERERQQRLEAEWHESAHQDPQAIAEANDWSDVMPDSEPSPVMGSLVVTLVTVGERKPRVVSALRRIWPDLSMAQVLALLKQPPTVLLDGGSAEDVASIVPDLERAGAQLKVEDLS
jgi:ribosomal protein L7/L12